jgi:hypothetical protein
MRIRISLLVFNAIFSIVIYGGMNYLNMQAYKLLAGDQNIIFSGSLSQQGDPAKYIWHKKKGGGGEGGVKKNFLISFLVINLSQ